MNSFSLIGKFVNYSVIDKKHVRLTINSSSPSSKKIHISVIASTDDSIMQIKKGDLLGIKGFIDNDHEIIILKALNITWLSNK